MTCHNLKQHIHEQMIIWGCIGSTDDHYVVLRNVPYYAQLIVSTVCTTLVLLFDTFLYLKSKRIYYGAVLGAVIIIFQCHVHKIPGHLKGSCIACKST